jgi:hypothetical protein
LSERGSWNDDESSASFQARTSSSLMPPERCTIDPNEIMQKAGGGAQCSFETGQ